MSATTVLIEIEEDNAPPFATLESRCDNTCARQFVMGVGPKRHAYANFIFRQGVFEMECRAPSNSEINQAARAAGNLAPSALSRIETSANGIPSREFQPCDGKPIFINLLIIDWSGELARVNAPTDAEAHQVLSFLARCKALA